MLYKIAICDDNNEDIVYIQNIINKWADIGKHNVKIDKFMSAEAFLFHYAECKEYNILFLDIEMKHMNGIELAKKVRKLNKEIIIIFATGYMDYIEDGYDVEALHYLIKPLKESKVYEVLDKALNKIKQNSKALFLQVQGEMMRIPLYDIRYIDVQKNYVTIHATCDITVKMTLSDIEKELDDCFLRTGRSYIINISYIKKVTKTEIYLTSGEIVPLPRGMYKPLNKAIIQFL